MKTENKIKLSLSILGIGLILIGKIYTFIIGGLIMALLFFFADDDYDNFQGV